MRTLFILLVFLLPAGVLAQTPRERTVESIVPWLAYNSSCSSTLELRNLGDRDVSAILDAHKSTGALAPLAGSRGNTVRLTAGEHASYKLQIDEETDGAWVRVREKIPAPELAPVLAVSAATECISGDRLNTTVRDVAWPLRNPFYSADVTSADDGIIAFVNASELPAAVSGCYSSGSFYAVPRDGSPAQLTPLCSDSLQDLVPPFGTRKYPVARGGNTHFSMRTRGSAIVLEMLRPAAAGAKIYRVDTAITFGEEAPAR